MVKIKGDDIIFAALLAFESRFILLKPPAEFFFSLVYYRSRLWGIPLVPAPSRGKPMLSVGLNPSFTVHAYRTMVGVCRLELQTSSSQTMRANN